MRGKTMAGWSVALFCAGVWLHAPAMGAAPSAALSEARKLEKAWSDTIKKVAPAYVFIGGGSGVLISPDGLMLTNHHVAGSSKRWRVRVGEKAYTAVALGNDPRGDITLLQIQDAKGLPYVEFADSDNLIVGQQVIAVGNPFMTAELLGEPTVTQGIVSALHRFQSGYSDAIQTDAPINPGNSGGPLLTLEGKLAGINGQIATRFGARANTGIGMAIPAKQIQRFMAILKAANGGTVYHGYIRGLIGEGEETDGVQNGAELKEIRAGSYAEKLGMKKGDRITSFDGYKVLNFSRLLGIMGTYPAEAEVKIVLDRSGTAQTITAKLEKFNPAKLELDPQRGPMNGTMIVGNVKGAAAKAGIKSGDQIVEFNGRKINMILDWQRVLFDFRLFRETGMAQQFDFYAGETATVKVKRGTKEAPEEVEIKVVLDSAF